MERDEAIPILDLKPQIDAQWEELRGAMETVVRSGNFILGSNVAAFESELAAYLGVRHAIGVNSGTDALILSLRALRIGPGDEVITSPFTFFATAEAISLVGATPVFADIDDSSLNLDPESVRRHITPRTKAILPVHLFGLPCDMTAFQEIAAVSGLHLLEDCAQSMGAEWIGKKAGGFGAASAFSFFPSKNLGAFGDAGAVATNDDDLAERVRLLRVHGSRRRYFHEELGYNSRLDELQATILRIRLRHLDEMNGQRRQVASRYRELLSSASAVRLLPESTMVRHVYHQFTIRLPEERRDAVQNALTKAGIMSIVYYPFPLHRLPMYDTTAKSLPTAEQAAREVLSLPIWPELSLAKQERIVAAIDSALQ